MGRLNDFAVKKISERVFNPEELDFNRLETEVEETLRSWNVPFNKPRRTVYHDSLRYDAEGNAFQGINQPWLDRVDISLKQQYSEDDLKLTLMEEYLHKTQHDFFLGHPTSEFNEKASTLEENFQEYWEMIETEIESGFLSSARERTIEGSQDMKIAALPEIGVEYDQIIEDAQASNIYRIAQSRALKDSVKQHIEQNEKELLEVAEPLVDRNERYRDIYHIQPVNEAFADIVDSHLNRQIGSKMNKWAKIKKSNSYPLGVDTELYENLIEEYQNFEGSRDEKISHVLELMPKYLEEQYENGELPNHFNVEEVEIL